MSSIQTGGVIADIFGEKHITIVALGDSNTQVTHWTHGSLNWVGLLECNAGTAFRGGCTIINSGKSGDTVSTCIDRLERDVLRFAPDLVIIGFGSNDATISDNIEKFTQDLTSVILQLKSIGSEIVLRTPPPVINMNDGSEQLEIPGKNGLIRDTAAYSAEIVRLADKYSCRCVDHYNLWKKSMKSKYGGEMMLLMGNTLHPNGNGHRRLYSEIASVIGTEPLFQFEWKHLLEVEDFQEKYNRK